MAFFLALQLGLEMSQFWYAHSLAIKINFLQNQSYSICRPYWAMVSMLSFLYQIVLIQFTGGSLVSKGAISVGDLSSLLLYTVYVGSGLQMLT